MGACDPEAYAMIVLVLYVLLGITARALSGLIGILGAWTYWKHGDVDLRIAAFVCIGFLFGSLLGARLATHLPNLLLERIFGGATILIAIKMLLAR
jgi:uncharacterized membrane protein YfcA